jgi:hypothetical protein
MSFLGDLFNTCLNGQLFIQNTYTFVGVCVANDTHYINYMHKKTTNKKYHNIKKSNYVN